MSNASHTQGPWNVSRHATPDYAPQFGIYAGESARDLATVTGDNAAADAALIEAAPDLLAACEALLNCIDPARDWNEAKAARAAIAKAKGGAA